MWKFRSLLSVLLVCLPAFAAAAAQRSAHKTSSWKTLKGDAPLVIARGGFSGLFPDSSLDAYQLAMITGLPNIILWCDVQLTSDRYGVCLPNLTINNGSNIVDLFENKRKTYVVNGIRMTGWFAVDFTRNDLTKVSLTQGVYSRTPVFDSVFNPVLTVQDVARQFKPTGLWLNIQYAAFYSQLNLSMRSFVLSASRSVIVNYISSPEVNFLRSIVTRFKPTPTKLVFRFLGENDTEPSTNQTYGSFLKNLTFVKTFASGILVPKSYIWPVDNDLYLQSHTPIVFDAHNEGLEIFASDFSNDVPFAYNFSYDPVAEYLKFIDSDNFSVDGVLSDFPITPSEAIDCYSHMDTNDSGPAIPLVISHEGASGVYPGCTDLAYTTAISDGADILDCPVQMTKDKIPFCLGSINLMDRTTAAQHFSLLMMNIPQLKGDGIFSFNLSWSQIQSLQQIDCTLKSLNLNVPACLLRSTHQQDRVGNIVAGKSQVKINYDLVEAQIFNPYAEAKLYRNPRFKNAGKLMSLSDFLALANNATSVSGVLIRVENALYLAEHGMDVTDAVVDALSKAGYNNQKVKKVMIQSSSSAFLIKLKEKSNNYELVYNVNEVIRDVLNSTMLDITKFANSLVIKKESVYSRDKFGFLTGATGIVPKLKAFKLPVYAALFQNEFYPQAWDFFSDAHVELNSFVVGAEMDGVITDFPGTANKYRRNRCLTLGDNIPTYMAPVKPGSLLKVVQPQPPASPPSPVLAESDVMEPPFPAVSVMAPTTATSDTTAKPPSPTPNGQAKVVVGFFLSNLSVLLPILLLF